ncbi:tyrosine-type recombinase/integrase [Clostridium saccharoperbutylacetonicum]|uniref:tyrosine-type recombinase/integrase n=1 Tax=Clostridium saccharoperbutylacetonicum TaxID=36745 RepID=UPI000983EB84|nr:site-specific integrase [Clostridium saccharoperbutylacetonicum]AQR95955.1 tyrosine recombinase XerC [Clostridium saccharoperbutylacetonicum]NSB31822.1 site-specific recombinase XerD [Clostridium saccharoperbutylacetonicum]
MELLDTIKNFLEEITSQRTKDSYTKKITSFYDFLTKQNKISNETYKNYFAGIDIDVIEQALDYYIKNQNIESESAAYHYKSVIRMYFDYIQNLGIVADNLIKSFSIKSGINSYSERINLKIKNDSRLKERMSNGIITKDEAIDIVDQCDRNIKNLIEKDNFLNFKKRADNYTNLLGNIIIKFILFTGCKYSALNSIRVNDLNFDTNILNINGYEITLPKNLSLQIRQYIRIRTDFCNKNNQSLFIKQNGEEIDYTNSFLSNILSYFRDGNIQVTMLIKFAIVQMISVDINKDVIKSFTKNSDDIYTDCFNYVYENDSAFRNRYLNSKLRSMEWYDRL